MRFCFLHAHAPPMCIYFPSPFILITSHLPLYSLSFSGPFTLPGFYIFGASYAFSSVSFSSLSTSSSLLPLPAWKYVSRHPSHSPFHVFHFFASLVYNHCIRLAAAHVSSAAHSPTSTTFPGAQMVIDSHIRTFNYTLSVLSLEF